MSWFDSRRIMAPAKLIFDFNSSNVIQTFDTLNWASVHLTFSLVHMVKFSQLCQMIARNFTPTNTNLIHKLYTWPCFLVVYTKLSLKWLFHFYCDSFGCIRAFSRFSFHLGLGLLFHLVLNLPLQLLNLSLQFNKLIVKIFRVLIKEPVWYTVL